VNPHERDARIAKMKDGSTHLAHKADHAVDMETGSGLAVTLQEADQGDTATVQETLLQAGENVAELLVTETEKAPEEKRQVYFQGVKEVVTDKGYHSSAVLVDIKDMEVRTYIPEKKQTLHEIGMARRTKRKRERNKRRLREPAASWAERMGRACYGKEANSVERSFAHCYETGGMRRTHLRGQKNILKRLLIHVGAFNLSLIFRSMLGAGKPRELKNRHALVSFLLLWVIRWFPETQESKILHFSIRRPSPQQNCRYLRYRLRHSNERNSATGC